VLGTLNTDDFEDNRVKISLPNKFIILHDEWNKTGKLENDIALIKLPVGLNLPGTSNCKIDLRTFSYICRSLFFSVYISTIRMPKDNQATFSSKSGIVSGWGRINPGMNFFISPTTDSFFF
jgi:hypothetical protein